MRTARSTNAFSSFARLGVIAGLVLSLASCATTEFGPKTGIGAASGAAAGGLIGAAADGGTTGILAGVLLGGLAGGAVGNYLDQQDRVYLERNAYGSLESSRTGQTSDWVNPDSGNRGSFTPERTYQTASGQPCREFTHTILVDGRKERGYGTACREGDGTWRIVR
jgi:surface antigen